MLRLVVRRFFNLKNQINGLSKYPTVLRGDSPFKRFPDQKERMSDRRLTASRPGENPEKKNHMGTPMRKGEKGVCVKV